jgi:WD40 repeat protein
MVVQHVVATPPAPSQFNPSLSPAFEQALLIGLAKDPTRRPPSATTFVDGLRQTLTTPLVSGYLASGNLTSGNLASGYLTGGNLVRGDAASAHLSSGQISSHSTTTGQFAGNLTTQSATSAQLPARPMGVSRRNLLITAGAGTLAVGGGLAAVALSPVRQMLFPTPAGGAHTSAAGTSTAFPAADVPVLQIKAILNKPAVQLAWSPVANTLAVLGGDDQMLFWHIQPGQTGSPAPSAKQSFGDSTREGLAFAWSPGGDMLALRGVSYNAELQVYKSDLSGFASGFSLNSFTFQGTSIGGSVCWGPGKYILFLRQVDNLSTSQSDTTLYIYNPAQPQQSFPPIAVTMQDGSFVNQTMPVALSPDGSTLAISGNNNGKSEAPGVLVGKIMITGTQAHWQPYPLLQTHPGDVPAMLAWSPDGHYLAAAAPSDISHTLYMWDATQNYKSLPSTPDLSQIDGSRLVAVAWSPTNHSQFAIGTLNGRIYLWNVGSSAPVRTLSASAGGVSGQVTSLGWSHDGRWLAASFDDTSASILVWKIG